MGAYLMRMEKEANSMDYEMQHHRKENNTFDDPLNYRFLVITMEHWIRVGITFDLGSIVLFPLVDLCEVIIFYPLFN